MSGKDIMLFVWYALLEEEKRAYENRSSFTRNDITIFMSEEAFFLVQKETQPYVCSVNMQQKLYGCNVKIIREDGPRVYIGVPISIYGEG